jgi:hypothetical protein
MSRQPIDVSSWIPAAAAGLLALALLVIGLSAKADLFFYQMAVCSAVVAVALGVLARRRWNGRSYWNHSIRHQSRQH